jgi:hypothetical protein
MGFEFGRDLKHRFQVVDRLRIALSLGCHSARLHKRVGSLYELSVDPGAADSIESCLGDHLDVFLQGALDSVGVPTFHCPQGLENK